MLMVRVSFVWRRCTCQKSSAIAGGGLFTGKTLNVPEARRRGATGSRPTSAQRDGVPIVMHDDSLKPPRRRSMVAKTPRAAAAGVPTFERPRLFQRGGLGEIQINPGPARGRDRPRMVDVAAMMAGPLPATLWSRFKERPSPQPARWPEFARASCWAVSSRIAGGSTRSGRGHHTTATITAPWTCAIRTPGWCWRYTIDDPKVHTAVVGTQG